MHPAASLQGKKALVVGLGDTGASCVRWLMERDAIVRGTDSREEPPHAQHLREAFPEVRLSLGGFRREDFAWADLLVLSPGVALATPEVAAAVAAGKDVVGDVELFARAIRGSHGKLIAITGSNGKSTVTALTGHLCAAYGLDTVVAGNIGLPVLEALEGREALGQAPDVWVLELSSFQLETTRSLEADAATVLNISQDHLDRYVSLADYAAAKARIFGVETDVGRAKASCIQVLNREDAAVRAMALPGHTQWSFGLEPACHPGADLPTGHFGLGRRGGRLWMTEAGEGLLPVDKLPIDGLHNAANALAALALCRAIGLDYDGLLPALQTFEGLPHRVQRVAEVAGRVFYDDSKGTNVGATLAALKGLSVPVVWIAGGDGKGQDFSPLRAAAGQVRALVQIGRDGPRIAASVAGACPVTREESLQAAVDRAFELSRPGDVILLSPACASWDMFRDYKHRAEVFVTAVEALKARAEAAAGKSHVP
ncbi:MAG TPA: UDP-N-acetylmuramoyl-L-alanine--D-glutamate ligase [Thiobacillaceae bacterium]|nr:UDP-N-acetylmuramoyl-L-alanine--D-glutamate ligase [Thiobacillaceae bacterium]HNU63712.1 UDP-N-acetylmuramoyl-L-alanine--D-glutamate ligase [Thiobacillaceae bacterium]